MLMEEFLGAVRSPAGYTTAPGVKPLRGGILTGLKFYVGGVAHQIRVAYPFVRRGVYDVYTFGQMSFELMQFTETLGATVRFEGFHTAFAAPRPSVFVANHMSLIETMLLPAGLFGGTPTTVVAKSSLGKYPYFGKVLLASQAIMVDRKNPRDDLETVLREGTKRLHEGCSVLLFPQGTRLDTFDARHFNSLGVKLAKRAGVPIVPIACKTDFAEKGKIIKDVGKVYPERPILFAAGAPLDSSGDQRALQKECTSHIERKLEEWNMPVVKA